MGKRDLVYRQKREIWVDLWYSTEIHWKPSLDPQVAHRKVPQGAHSSKLKHYSKTTKFVVVGFSIFNVQMFQRRVVCACILLINVVWSEPWRLHRSKNKQYRYNTVYLRLLLLMCSHCEYRYNTVCVCERTVGRSNHMSHHKVWVRGRLRTRGSAKLMWSVSQRPHSIDLLRLGAWQCQGHQRVQGACGKLVVSWTKHTSLVSVQGDCGKKPERSDTSHRWYTHACILLMCMHPPHI